MPRPRLYTKVPIFNQVIWNSCRNPYMGLIYELGIHVQYQEIPTECFAEIQQSICKRKHHITPIGKLQNLQCMCIIALQKTYGAKKVAHYRLCPQTHTPFIFFNKYIYHVYYKSNTNDGQSLSLYVVTLLLKYGVDFTAPIVQECFLSRYIITDPALLRYSLYHIYTRCQELLCGCSQCKIPGFRHYYIRCVCRTCQFLNALYYLIQTSKRGSKRTLTSQRQQMSCTSLPFIKYIS